MSLSPSSTTRRRVRLQQRRGGVTRTTTLLFLALCCCGILGSSRAAPSFRDWRVWRRWWSTTDGSSHSRDGGDRRRRGGGRADATSRRRRRGNHHRNSTTLASSSPSNVTTTTTTTTTSAGSDKNNHESTDATTMASALSPAHAIYNSFQATTDELDDAQLQQQQRDENDDDNDYDDSKRLWSTSRRMTKKRQQFLDRIALMTSLRLDRDAEEEEEQQDRSNGKHYKNGNQQKRTDGSNLLDAMDTADDDATLDAVTSQSDLTRPGRHFHVVTTAALPWFTGTAVNPLLRAAYLHRATQRINANHNHHTQTSAARYVTLVVPWLELPDDQEALYGGATAFDDPAAQEAYIRSWLADEAGLPDAACPTTGIRILFYPARHHAGLGSIFAMGDIMDSLTPRPEPQPQEQNDHSATASSSSSSDNTDDEPSDALDVCILEEPEHCNWYRAPGHGWRQRFNYVVGIVHTNYKEYASGHYSGLWTAPAIALLSSAMVRAYCDKVIKLSDTLQEYAVEKESTANVHGVRSNFVHEGERRRSVGWGSTANQTTEVYFIGKLLWAKGLDLMVELEDYYKGYTGEYFAIDVYGSGPDQKAIMKAFHGRKHSTGSRSKKSGTQERSSSDDSEDDWDQSTESDSDSDGLEKETVSVRTKGRFSRIRERGSVKAKKKIAKFKETINAVDIPQSFYELRRQPIPATFPGRVDHGALRDHKVFVNPSLSEVLCTTTAEALAMGKFAIIPVHPSNTFFLQFPNCLAYRDKFEFVANLRWALTHDPEPLTPSQAHAFTWEAATDRFMATAAITRREALARERLGLAKLDERIAWFHNELGKGTSGDLLRKVLGAGPASHQVKYQKVKAVDGGASAVEEDSESSSSDDEEEDDDYDDGSSIKFRRSSFAEAIRATIGDLTSFGMQ